MNFPEPRIIFENGRTLVGKRLLMSHAVDRTPELWRSFMPRRADVQHRIGNDLFSLRVYSEPVRPGDMFQQFERWAASEVSDANDVPEGMEALILAGCLYAVFHYKGLNTDTRIFAYIFGEWLLNSVYILDERPHFEVLGEKYANGSPDSEEDIWIPIRTKQ